jgi:hypothetical protein
LPNAPPRATRVPLERKISVFKVTNNCGLRILDAGMVTVMKYRSSHAAHDRLDDVQQLRTGRKRQHFNGRSMIVRGPLVQELNLLLHLR